MTISPVSPKSPQDFKTSAIKDEIVVIWSQVQARVIQLAGGDSNQVRRDLTIENVLAHLDQVLEDSSPKESAIRSTVDNTLKFIDTVGGVVAGGASEDTADCDVCVRIEVFGPAELCFNAVSLVIHAWQGYRDVFESLAGLLDKCSQYLSRLEYYIRGGMDARLAKVACQHLQLFVEICDRTIKLRHSKRRKLMVFSKFFFLNDNDIQDLLDKMDSLIDREGRLVTAQTFSFASQAAVGTKENLVISKAVNSKIDMLIANRSDQIKENDTQHRRDLILKRLAFDENKLDRERHEPDPFWQRAYQNFRKLVVPDTGQWCFSEPLFVAWERNQDTSPSILGIEGVEGTGKSYLASTIIRRLRNRSSVDSCGSRTLLAFYFLEGDSKEELKRTNHLDLIIKSLVWQFTQADASYSRLAAGVCEETNDLDPHEIPDQFLFNKDLAQIIDATFFIVIDGIGDIVGDALVKFLRRVSTLTPDHQRVRVLLTGRPRAFEQLGAVKGMSFEKISISTRNQSDVEKYTQSRMDHIEALKDTSRMGIPELRQKICESLCEKTAGDYFRINTILKHISTLDYVHDIDQVLKDAGKERSEQILVEIEKLNQTLSPKEIAEVNEIILWILYGREWFKPRQMAAVLYEKSGDLSLLPLHTKLQIKYSLFEVDSDGDIDFRSYEITELIPERRQSLDGDEDSASGATKKIKSSEVTIVRHFLSTVCPPELYDRFEFESFFEQKLRGRGGHIYRDEKDTAEVRLAVTCLRVLTEKRDGRREILRPYAVSYILQHLSSVDLAFVDRAWKAAVGPRLLKLFTDASSTDALLWTKDLQTAATFAWHARSAWLDSNEGVTEVLRWFRDSAVVSSISDHKGRGWVTNLVASSSPQMDLLGSFVKRMAVHWLRETSPQPLACNAFSFLFDSMRKMKHGERCEEHSTPKNQSDPTVEGIYRVENWCRTLLETKEADSLWEVQVATVLQNFSFEAEAQKRCQNALELDAANWRASFYLARAVASDEEAIKILEDVSARLQQDSEWMQEGFHRKALAEMLFDLGQRYWFLEKFDLATQSYNRSIETNYTGYNRALVILEQYQGQHRWTDIVALLGKIQDTSGNTQSLSDMLVNLATKESIHEIILQTAIETEQFSLLERMYDDAIKLASELQAYTSLYYVRYHFANALFQEVENEERAVALWEIALKDDLPRSFLDVEEILPSLTIKLAPVYLRRARAAEHDSEMAHEYLRRISEILPDEVAENKILFPAKLYLSRYYQVKGDQAKAKQIARSVVKISLEILSDDDKHNDYLAYWRLLLVFLPLADDQNASAAVIMAALASQSSLDTNTGREEALLENLQDTAPETPNQDIPDKTEKSQSKVTPPIDTAVDKSPRQGEEPPTKPEPRPISTSPTTAFFTPDSPSSPIADLSLPPPQIFAVCDGECGHYWETASEMWWCKDCINLTFDRDCFEKLQKGTLPLNICDKNHEFLVIPKWDHDKMRRIPRGYVPYGERAISLEEWKGIIRKMYVELDV
ncbi:hypothetical protein N8T08_001491 [Aspergillus melleus]|uniref:Uncharacterized protein n=1 Tax=Aspergillus melleus TaxID=138277 RepID=A0ACC3BAG2_9EURO|nr:hypothetical protein N8T08_001491 [Aspergillus melleus]